MKTLIALTLTALSISAQQLPLASPNWRLYYAYSNTEISINFPKAGGGMSWDVPLSKAQRSPGSPYVTGEWAGYLQYRVPYKKTNNFLALPDLTGSILIQGNITVSSPSVAFNYNSESFNTCPTPASLHVEFEGTNAEITGWRYWNINPIWLVPGTFSWAGTMDPTQWIDVNGESAAKDAQHLADFNATRLNTQTGAGYTGPYFVGATHGGGCFYGHGVNVSGGTASVTISSFSINQ